MASLFRGSGGSSSPFYTPPPALHCEPLIRAIQAAGGTSLQAVYYPTDHAFSDYRLTVAETVEDFLKKQFNE